MVEGSILIINIYKGIKAIRTRAINVCGAHKFIKIKSNNLYNIIVIYVNDFSPFSDHLQRMMRTKKKEKVNA